MSDRSRDRGSAGPILSQSSSTDTSAFLTTMFALVATAVVPFLSVGMPGMPSLGLSEIFERIEQNESITQSTLRVTVVDKRIYPEPQIRLLAGRCSWWISIGRNASLADYSVGDEVDFHTDKNEQGQYAGDNFSDWCKP